MKQIAAIDLGSNSFRVQHASVGDDGGIVLGSYWRDPLRLAAGLQDDGTLSEQAQQRALASLREIAQQIASLPDSNVQAVGTAALRSARNAGSFLPLAEAALGHSIEILSGPQEAELGYRGCVASLPDEPQRRLVLDIGGASTELALGVGRQPQAVQSWNTGAVRMTVRHFDSGRITREALDAARGEAASILAGAGKTFGASHWDAAWGSAGTVGTLCLLIRSQGWADGSQITRALLGQARAFLLEAGSDTSPLMAPIRPDRRHVIAGGLAILEAVFQEIGIETIHPAQGAVRIGILLDLARRAC